MENDRYAQKKLAGLAGLTGFVMGLPLPFSLLYIPSKIVVSGNVTATANNLLANELMFRSGIAGHLFSAVVFLFLVTLLYRLLKPVNENRAKLMVLFVVVQVPLSFIIETINFTALMVLKGELLKSLPILQRQDFSVFLLRINRYGISVQQIFWGAWLLPYGLLVFRSGFIPRLFGILLFVNGIGLIVESLSFLLLQRNTWQLIRQFTFVTYFGELPILLWLLIKGVRNNLYATNNERTIMGLVQ